MNGVITTPPIERIKIMAEEKPQEQKVEKSTKSASQRLREAGEEVIMNEELMNSGGLCIIGARMPRPKDDPPPPPTPEKPV
jgi:hypothetical protein